MAATTREITTEELNRQIGLTTDVSFLNGIGKSADKLVALLNMDRLLSDGDLQEVATLAAA